MLFVAVFALTACGGGSSSSERGHVQDSAGVRLVHLGAAQGSFPVTSLPLDDDWHSLAGSEGELVDVRTFSDGRVAALDRMSAAVVVLSAAGTPTAWIGGPGEGPGELSSGGLTRILVTDSSITVPDLFQQRISEFSLTGELASTSPFPGGGGYAVDWQWGGEGTFAYRLLHPDGDVLIRSSPAAIDTLHVFAKSTGHPNLLLPTVALWALSDRRLAVASSGTWAVDVYEVSPRRQVWGVRRNVDPPAFTRSDRQSLVGILEASATAELGGRQLTAEESASLLSQVAFPESGPVLAGLLFAPNGDLWVQNAKPVARMEREALRVGSAEGYGGPEWDVLDSTGMLRTRVHLPDGFAPREFAGELLYGIAEDQFGVNRVTRVVIPWH